MEIHETLNSQKNLEKEQNIGALTFSHFKTYYKATVNNKTVWYWHNDRHTVQQNKSAEGTEAYFAIWFGEGGTPVAPDGHNGKFSFKGFPFAKLSGKGVDEVAEMVVGIVPSTKITFAAS